MATLVAHLAEMEERGLHLKAGYPSLFVYCVRLLRLSEGGAYNRIEAARTARRFPAVLDMLENGLLSLASLRLLAPHLTAENHEALLASASGKGKREVLVLLAKAFPRPDVRASIRKLPTRDLAQPDAAPGQDAAMGVADASAQGVPDAEGAPVSAGAPWPSPDQVDLAGAEHGSGGAIRSGVVQRPAPPRHPVVTPLSPDRYQIRFTAGGRLCEKLKKAQDLLRHAVPDGDPAEVIERALTVLLAELERKKFAATERPRAAGRPATSALKAAPGSRTIPAEVKREVTARDDGICAFVAGDGLRCGTRAFLEFHHLVPYALGGSATADNIQLRCRAHNGYEARVDFGEAKMRASRGKARGASAVTRAGLGVSELVPGRVAHHRAGRSERRWSGRGKDLNP